MCKVDGQYHQNFDNFSNGMNGCAICACIDDQVRCDATQCQPKFLSQEIYEENFNDFVNIKNQIAKQYFAEYDANKLKIITDSLGCKSIDCPRLLSVTSIDYDVIDFYRREYAGRAAKQNKIIIHSTDAEAVNNSPSKQEVQTVSYSLKVTQYFEVIITKTSDISSEVGITISFVSFGVTFKFGKTTKETKRESNETTLEAPSQKIIVDPYTKINVTFNFYQYNDINKYFIDFEIGKNSMIKHPEVDDNSNVVFVKKPIGEFLEKHIDFLSTLTYENETDIKLEAKDEKFILRNFPATEKITNFGVDVVYGKPEEIK